MNYKSVTNLNVISVEPQTLRYLLEYVVVRIEPWVEEVGYSVMLAGGGDQRVTLQDFDVVLNEPVLDAQKYCQLVQIARPLPEGSYYLRSALAAPRPPEKIPEEPSELRIVWHCAESRADSFVLRDVEKRLYQSSLLQT
jgi:hypothetical protein